MTRAVLRIAPGRGRILLAGLVLLAAGCRGGAGGGAMVPPVYSADSAAAAAMAEYDADKDGALDAKELEHCPALKEALKRGLDKNKDGKVTADELVERLRMFQEDGIGSAFVQVTLDGKPLAGATVTFTPEKFLGPSFKPATGTTGPEGTTMLQVDGQAAVAYGFYRVEISKNAGGKETLPAKYNAQTTLGKDFASARALNRRGQEETLVFRLTSR